MQNTQIAQQRTAKTRDRHFPVFVAAWLVSLLSTTLSAQQYPRQQVQPAVSQSQPHPGVCRIMVPEHDGVSYGSGTLIAVKDKYGVVITNWHVVQGAAEVVTVAFPDGFRSGARVIRLDEEWDLAALLIWRPSASPVPISTTSPRPGDVLTIAGYGSGRYREATGRCTQYVSPGVNLPFEMVELSAQARQGDSGGPIFNARGELAGVLFGASHGTTAGSYAGRVGTFLASISPSILETPDDSVIAQTSPNPSLQPLPRTEPEPPREETRQDQLVNVQPSQSPPEPTGEPPAPAFRSQTRTERPTSSITLSNILGTTPLDWAKSLLAAIGIVAVLVRVMRLLES